MDTKFLMSIMKLCQRVMYRLEGQSIFLNIIVLCVGRILHLFEST